MNNPGIYDLGTCVITAPLTGEVVTDGISAESVAQEFIDRLEGMSAVTLFARMAYGSGGTAVKVWFQTSLDQGATWIDIACVVFGTASETAVVNLSGLTPKTNQISPTDGALADDTAVDGVLGDRLRAKITTTGTYAGNTQLILRAAVR